MKKALLYLSLAFLLPYGFITKSPLPKARVSVFFSLHCPMCVDYIFTLNQLTKTYQAQNIRFTFYFTGKSHTAVALDSFSTKHNIQAQTCLDASNKKAKKIGAQFTPEVVIQDSLGKTIYHGAIDNRYADIGQKNNQATRHYLRDALDQYLKGEPISITKTTARGCSIHGL